MACTLNLMQKYCSELTSRLGTSVQQGTCSYGKGHLCPERPKGTGYLSEVVLEIQGMPHAICMSSKVLACRDNEGWEMGPSLPKCCMHQLCGCNGPGPCGPVNPSLNFGDFYSQERCNLQCFWAELFAD